MWNKGDPSHVQETPEYLNVDIPWERKTHSCYIAPVFLPSVVSWIPLWGFCLHHSLETALLKITNCFQGTKSESRLPVPTLYDFSEEFHEVDPPSFLKHFTPLLSRPHILLGLLPAPRYSSVTFAGSSSFSTSKCSCLRLCFHTSFSSLSLRSLWGSHPAAWFSNHPSASDNKLHPPELHPCRSTWYFHVNV